MFWDIFYSECEKQGTSPNAVCKAIGLSNAIATHWKDGTQPKADVLVKIADFLNVSVDYLLGREPQNPPITIEPHTKWEWTEILQQLDMDDLQKLKSYAEYLLAKKSAP